jgi:DNA invertase Pin-like site-specific DNA recombinase
VSIDSKVTAAHLRRTACVYIRQSTAAQVELNRESTQRQYGLMDRAVSLGWCRERVKVIDCDLGTSGAGGVQRDGFTSMTAETALGNIGLILSIEVSRVARSSSDWYRLLDLCAMTDTLIGDEDGLYHPGHFNDRLLLGLKGTMAEAELHVIRARLDGGIRNKAARGELRRGLPVGYVWGDADGEVLFHPDEAVTTAIRTVFEKFAEFGSARRVWIWFQSEGLPFPHRSTTFSGVRWAAPTYTTIHGVLKNPVYAGVYVYGRTRHEKYIDEKGRARKRVRRLPRSEWSVFIKDHHQGFIDWETFEMNQQRLSLNTKPRPHDPAGAVRNGAALLQSLAVCGNCGRKLLVYYQGRNSTPGYYCANGQIVNGRAQRCMRVGAIRIDRAVSRAFLEEVATTGPEAALQAQKRLHEEWEAAVNQWRLQVERLEYQALLAERRYRGVDPDNRLVAGTLETEWDRRLTELAAARAELARREQNRPAKLHEKQLRQLHELGCDLPKVWNAATTTDRDRKELIRSILESVAIHLDRGTVPPTARLVLRWRGGLISELTLPLPAPRNPTLRTDEDTIDLLRRLAEHYPDSVIAGILNQQGRTTVTGERFTANRVGSLRRYRKIPRYRPGDQPESGELLSVIKAAKVLGVATSTLHRWIADGFVRGEQLTPGAPWRIRMTEELKARFREDTPKGYVTMKEAMRQLEVSRQTVLQRVKDGRLQAVHVRIGRHKGLRIKLVDQQPGLFGESSTPGV